MATIIYKEYQIEIRPVSIPGGWSAQVHVWSCKGGTTRMTALSLPTHLAFSTVEGVQASAEKVARQWVNRVLAEESRPPQKHLLPLTR
jgi:hypothetical protein